MKALHIENTKLAHQCARCMRSYPTMYRHEDDGLVYCSQNGTCREIPKGAKISVQPTQRSGRPAPKKASAKKSTAKRPAKKAAAPKKRTRART